MDVNISKPENRTKIIEIRPTTSITVDRFSKHFDPNKILEAQTLSGTIELFNNMVEHAIDQIVPVKKVTSTRNITQPWYDNDIKAQHQIVRRGEWLWKKYKLKSLWKAYQQERNHYVKMIRYKKQHHMCIKIKSKKNDTKNLYKLINHLTRNETQNRLPYSDSDSDLSNRFASYFIEKIDRIRDKFNNIPPYKQ